MSRSAYHQSAFLGGAIGPLSQGRSDLPMYHQAMSLSMNAIIAEEGAWIRRSGFQFLARTRSRTAAKLLPFFASDSAYDFVMEFTSGFLRFFNGTGLVTTTVSSAVTASSFAAGTLTLTVASATGMAIGDDIMLWSSSTFDPAKIQAFRGRVMRITNIAGAVLTVLDDDGGVFSGLSSTANDLVGTIVYQVAHLTTSWTTAMLPALRAVQVPNTTGGAFALILSRDVPPSGIRVTSPLVVTKTVETFVDGPYLDQQGSFVTPETGTVSAYSGSITFTPATSTFVAADVGRLIRFFQQPPAWASGTTYSYGQVVTYNDTWWTSIGTGAYAANVGFTPGTPGTFSGVQVTVWAPAPDQGVWAWGTITAQGGTTATVTLTTPLKAANGAAIAIWRLGVFTAAQYPTCGISFEGRLYLGGARPNRWDASMSNDPLVFSPTEVNGTVNDNNAISYVISAEDNNDIVWMASDQQGVLMGAKSGEWLIHSSVDGAITPTNVRADRVTRYGAAAMEPKRCGIALNFVQRYQRGIIEHMAEGFGSGRFIGRNLNAWSKHLAETGIEELAYQQETVPVLWARMGDGSLAGCTYRRNSRYITEEPVVSAWHEHMVGGNYGGDIILPATSMCVLPAPEGLTDHLYVVASDVAATAHYVMVLRPLFEEA